MGCPEHEDEKAKALLQQGVHSHPQTSAKAAVSMRHQQLAIHLVALARASVKPKLWNRKARINPKS